MSARRRPQAGPQSGMGIRFDMVDLRLFVHVVEAGSITAGAERCHLSLASASARVQGMESTLGTPLLERSRRGVAPTAAGQVLFQHARGLLLQAQRMTAELGDFAQGLRGHVRLYCNSASSHEHLPELLPAYLLRHPAVNVEVVEALGERIVQAVLAGSADIGLVVDATPTYGLETRPFRLDRLVIVAPLGHPLGQQGPDQPISVFETEAFDIVGLMQGSALQDTWDEHAGRRGVRLNYRVRLQSFEALCRVVAHGLGVALMPETAALRHAQHLPVQVLALKEPWLSERRVLICMKSFAALPTHTQRLVAHLSHET